ncbi:MAG: alpha/beta hydrolase [Solobacterium sp.]|nr:alpha/beta hydrolase [Solobacterium sp.]
MLWNAKNGTVSLGSTSMSYVSFGHGDRVFVLLPGLSDGLMTVRGKALLLANPYQMFFEKYTVYMFSRKDDMPEGYSIEDMADDQASALRLLSIRKASVMGVSQGGMIAQSLAVRYPDLVEKLVIAVSAPYANDMIRENIRQWKVFAEEGNHKELMIDTAEKSYSDAYLKKYRKTYPVIGLVGKPKDYRRFIINSNAILNFDIRPRLNEIQCPVLIIGGSEDRTVGIQASYEMHEQIRDSELYVYPGLGHAAYEEAEDFNARVFRFLES